MVKMKIFVSVCAALFILLNADKSDGKESKSSPPKAVNIIVILDTSNRVSKEKHPGQVERDKEIVRSIVDLFDQLVSGHFKTLKPGDTIEHPHRLTFVVPDQPRVPSIPQSIMKKLTIENQRGGKDKFIRQKETLLEGIDELYRFVQEQNQFTGADIWNWFRADAAYYFKDGADNRIICLSDGYLNFDKDIEAQRPEGTYMAIWKLRDEPKWIDKFQGLLPIKKDFSRYNAKFLMVEITLQKNPTGDIIFTQDSEIIERYWNTWLNSMGIMETKFIEQLNPDILKTTIEAFIK